MFEDDPYIQERGCFALITLCEVNNEHGLKKKLFA